MQKLKKKDTFKIATSFLHVKDKSSPIYLKYVKDKIKKILPKEILLKINEKNEKLSFLIKKTLPILKYEKIETPPCCFSFIALCAGEHTNGVGRFIGDMLCKWLIPGNQLPIPAHFSVNFTLSSIPNFKFYIIEYHIFISNKKRKLFIEKNIKNFTNQIRLNILSVYHARYVVSSKTLSLEEKSAVIKESLSSILNTKKMDIEKNAFDQMQNLIFKISAEKNLKQIRENLNKIMYKIPESADRDLFESMHNISYLFKDNFTATRDPKYTSKVISYYYLLKKMLDQKIYRMPKKRHVSIKLLRIKSAFSNKDQEKIGILLFTNLLQETERFEKKHLLKALKSLNLKINLNTNFFTEVKRENMIASFYFEIEKNNNKKFTSTEIKILRQKLPNEIKYHIENVINPIFMPRNEEEVLKNIILLSTQLKYVKDLPQLIITYDKQTSKEIVFTVILVRLLNSTSVPIKTLFANSKKQLNFASEEVKLLGYLKKKHQKESNIFRVSLNKTHFYRKDFSLDLQKARKKVIGELQSIIGEFRDYNGGMILTQSQALINLKKDLTSILKEKEFLIENFFYSIKPAVMQTVLNTQILKKFLNMFFSILNETIEKNNFSIKTLSTETHLIITIGAKKNIKEYMDGKVSSLKIASFNFTSCFFEEDGIYLLGYVFRSNDFSSHSFIYYKILNFMNLRKDLILK